MKHITRILLGGICSAGIAVSAADSSTLFEFDSEPELKPVVSKQKDSKDALKEYLLPITPTEGRSFALECDLELKTFNHYAVVLIGLSNGKQQKLLMKFNMGDDRLHRCAFIAQALAGISSRIRPFDKVELGKMQVAIEYSAEKRTVIYLLRDAGGKEIYTTGPVRVNGKFNLTNFVIGVTEDDNEAGEVSFDPAAKALFFRSYVGVEGEYPYTVEGMIDNVAIRVETPEVK